VQEAVLGLPRSEKEEEEMLQVVKQRFPPTCGEDHAGAEIHHCNQ